jgi:hypothetical protein
MTMHSLGPSPLAVVPPQRWGAMPRGRLIFPAVALWAFVPGIRAYEPKRGRDRLINFLIATFEEVVYI